MLVTSASAVDDPDAHGTVTLGAPAVGNPTNTFRVTVAVKAASATTWNRLNKPMGFVVNKSSGFVETLPLCIVDADNDSLYTFTSGALPNGDYTIWAIQQFQAGFQVQDVGSKFGAHTVNMTNNTVKQTTGGSIKFNDLSPARNGGDVSLTGSGTWTHMLGWKLLTDSSTRQMFCIPVDGGVVRVTSNLGNTYELIPKKHGGQERYTLINR